VISKNLLSKVKKIFPNKKLTVLVNSINELTILINDIKITFLHYPFSVLKNLIKYQGINLLSVKEITAAKAYTIGRRGALKNYIDLYFIIKEKHASLPEIVKLAKKKYKNEFNGRLFLEQLVYLKDIKEENIIFLKKQVRKQKLKNFFKKEISKLSF